MGSKPFGSGHGHGRWTYADCGHVQKQCRCIGPKAEHTVPGLCPACQEAATKAQAAKAADEAKAGHTIVDGAKPDPFKTYIPPTFNRYVSMPTEVEAAVWDGDSFDAWRPLPGVRIVYRSVADAPYVPCLQVLSENGWADVRPGSYVVVAKPGASYWVYSTAEFERVYRRARERTPGGDPSAILREEPDPVPTRADARCPKHPDAYIHGSPSGNWFCSDCGARVGADPEPVETVDGVPIDPWGPDGPSGSAAVDMEAFKREYQRDPSAWLVGLGLDRDAVEAERWFSVEAFAEGAPRLVGSYRHPAVSGGLLCTRCGRTFHDHGWIDQGADGLVVCPGDWIVDHPDGAFPLAPDIFHRLWPETLGSAPAKGSAEYFREYEAPFAAFFARRRDAALEALFSPIGAPGASGAAEARMADVDREPEEAVVFRSTDLIQVAYSPEEHSVYLTLEMLRRLGWDAAISAFDPFQNCCRGYAREPRHIAPAITGGDAGVAPFNADTNGVFVSGATPLECARELRRMVDRILELREERAAAARG